jgi:hypothetical protein
MRNNIEGVNIRGCTLYDTKFATGFVTLTANMVMSGDEPMMISVEPGAARDIRLPPEELGMMYIISNVSAGANTITVKDDSGVTTVGTIAQNATKTFICRAGVGGTLGWSISA